MATLAEIRQQYPQYHDLTDQQLADGLYKTHYSDIPRAEFDQKIGLQSSPEPQTSQSLGFYQGLMKPLDNAAQALEAGVNRIGINTGAINKAVGLPSAAETKQSHADYIAQMASRGVEPGGIGRFGGEVVGTLPVAALTKNPFVAGAVTGAALTDSTDVGGVAKDTVLGGIGGKIGDLAVRGAARVVRPIVNPYVQKLIDAGATLTPGQILGGAWKSTEDKLKSVPLLGDLIGSAQNETVKDVNRIAANRALAPIGKTVPQNIEAGQQMTAHIKQELGNAYDQLLPKMTLAGDQQLGQDIATIGQSNLVPSAKARLQEIIDTQLNGKLKAGAVTGKDLQGIGSELRRLASGYKKDPSFDNRDLGEQIGNVANAVDQALIRQNPAHAAELGKINEGWANYARIRRAGSSIGAKEGVYTPAQLNSAVKATDRSKDKGNFAQGSALMQDLSTAADQTITSKINDSGTAGRTFAGLALAGGGAMVSPKAVVASLALAAGYTKPGLAALQVALTKRPQAAQQIADLIRKGNRAGALAVANGLVGGVEAATAE